MTHADRIRKALNRDEPEIDHPKPGSVWELFADRRLTEIEENLRNIRNRIDTLLWALVAAIALAIFRFITGSI